MKGRPLFVALSAMFLVAGVARAQGFYIETVHPDKEKDVTRMYYMPRMLKTVDPDGQTTIVRVDKETVYKIDPDKKTYSSVTFAEVKAMMAGARSNMNEMLQKRLATLPPEQRKMMEEKLGAMNGQSASSPVDYQVVPAGETKTISGYACEKYAVRRNGKDYAIVWATRQISGFDSFKKDMDEVSRQFSSIEGNKRGLNLWFSQLEAFPVETDYKGNVSVATKVERTSFPSSEFEVPAGYTKDNKGME